MGNTAPLLRGAVQPHRKRTLIFEDDHGGYGPTRHAKAQNLHKLATDLEKQIGSKTSDDELRCKLRDAYVQVMLTDIRSARHRDVDQAWPSRHHGAALGRNVYYYEIERLRKLVKQ
eukprot:gene4167-4485_t